jgi:hypothetical protein
VTAQDAAVETLTERLQSCRTPAEADRAVLTYLADGGPLVDLVADLERLAAEDNEAADRFAAKDLVTSSWHAGCSAGLEDAAKQLRKVLTDAAGQSVKESTP